MRRILIILGIPVVTTVWVVFKMKQVDRELRQARLLQKQMEEDHGQLVQKVIELNDLTHQLKRVSSGRERATYRHDHR